MGKQYNKLIKRRRRSAYLARRKAALLTEKASGKKSTKSTTNKTVARKKAGTKATSKTSSKKVKEEVAEKAKPKDVLGPESSAEEIPTEQPEKDSESWIIEGLNQWFFPKLVFFSLG